MPVTHRSCPRCGATLSDATPKCEACAAAIAKGAMQDWMALFTNGLRRLQANGNEDSFVIFLADAPRNIYAQCVIEEGTTLHAELVSNEFLKGDAKLGPKHLDQLRSLGWNAPIPNEVPNHHRQWKLSDPNVHQQAAEALQQALLEVYRVAPTTFITVECDTLQLSTEAPKEAHKPQLTALVCTLCGGKLRAATKANCWECPYCRSVYLAHS